MCFSEHVSTTVYFTAECIERRKYNKNNYINNYSWPIGKLIITQHTTYEWNTDFKMKILISINFTQVAMT